MNSQAAAAATATAAAAAATAIAATATTTAATAAAGPALLLSVFFTLGRRKGCTPPENCSKVTVITAS